MASTNGHPTSDVTDNGTALSESKLPTPVARTTLNSTIARLYIGCPRNSDMRWIRLISTNMKASPISRKYALLHRMMFALERRVELSAGLMMTVTTTTIDMITRVNNDRDAVRFPCSTP